MSTLGKIANGINDDLILFGGENVNLLSLSEFLCVRHI